MSLKIYAPLVVYIFIAVGSVSVSAKADTAGPPKLNILALRILFQTPAYNAICPLDVYNEDYTTLQVIEDQADGLRRAEVTIPESKTSAAMPYRNSDLNLYLVDGLDVYSDKQQPHDDQISRIGKP